MWHAEGPDGGTGPFGSWLSNVLLKSLKSLMHSPLETIPKSTSTATRRRRRRIEPMFKQPKRGMAITGFFPFSPKS